MTWRPDPQAGPSWVQRWRPTVEGEKYEDRIYQTDRPVQARVRQGSLLEPELYTLYTYDVPKSPGTKLAIYADDIAVYAA